MYPSFSEVFTTKELLGIFYPLCTVSENLHFVSSNGLWMDEKYESESNSFEYTKFDFKNGKYNFKGDIRLYKGYEYAKLIFPILENDFETNGKNYLQEKLKTKLYLKRIKKLLPLQKIDDIDLEYYLETFYEFQINKLNYNLNGKFGEFAHLIEGWGKHESPIVYEDDVNSDARLQIQDNTNVNTLKDYFFIGRVVGHEFFRDGNDSVLYFNEKENKVLSFNYYD